MTSDASTPPIPHSGRCNAARPARVEPTPPPGDSRARLPPDDAHETQALTVLIPTEGRRPSLSGTLDDLALGLRGVRVHVVVIENSPSPSMDVGPLTRAEFASVRLLHEPRPGKAHALNRAIADGGLHRVIAVLDDDMAPDRGWCAAVVKSVACRPEFDIFSGRSRVAWPEGRTPPSWSRSGFAMGINFSVIDLGEGVEREMGVTAAGFPSGNHFWFRRAVLASVPGFPDVWPPEADFVVLARLAGHRGVFVPEVGCGHRVQEELFDARVLLDRASRFGAALARLESIRNGAGSGVARSLLRGVRAAIRTAAWRTLGGLSAVLPGRLGVVTRARAACEAARNGGRLRHAMQVLRSRLGPGARAPS